MSYKFINRLVPFINFFNYCFLLLISYFFFILAVSSDLLFQSFMAFNILKVLIGIYMIFRFNDEIENKSFKFDYIVFPLSFLLIVSIGRLIN